MGMRIDLASYMAYCYNKAAAKEEEEYKDFEKRVEEYKRRQEAEHARRQMDLNSLGEKIVREENERREAAFERRRMEELEALERRKRGGK